MSHPRQAAPEMHNVIRRNDECAAALADVAAKAEAFAAACAELALAMRGPLAEIGREFGRIHADHLARLAAADGATADNVELRA